MVEQAKLTIAGRSVRSRLIMGTGGAANLAVLREASAGRLRGAALARAARELLALQSSDWAFLDYGRQTGDYPFQRAVGHSRSLYEAIECGRSVEPALRNLAPDLTPAPLLEP